MLMSSKKHAKEQLGAVRLVKPARIQSLARADAILSVVMDSRHGTARLSEISAALQLNRTTIFNLAETLVTLGYLAHASGGAGYVLGLKNIQLGRAMARSMDLVDLCRPSLIKLCQDINETANLAVPYLNDAMIVESYECSHGVRATCYAGTRASYHSTACGKAILAHMSPESRRHLYESHGLVAHTSFTIQDVKRLERDLADVRKNGFSLEIEENEIGASCVGVAIIDAFDQPIAAMSVAGVVQRMTQDKIADTAARMIAEAASIQTRSFSLRGRSFP